MVPRASRARLASWSSPAARALRSTPRSELVGLVVFEEPDQQGCVGEALVRRRRTIRRSRREYQAANGSGRTTAAVPPTVTRSPSATSRRTTASEIGPNRGDSTEDVTRPTSRWPETIGEPPAAGPASSSSPRRPRLACPR